MLEKLNTRGKHLTVHDRTYIEDALKFAHTLKEMAIHLVKTPLQFQKKLKEIEFLRKVNPNSKGDV